MSHSRLSLTHYVAGPLAYTIDLVSGGVTMRFGKGGCPASISAICSDVSLWTTTEHVFVMLTGDSVRQSHIEQQHGQQELPHAGKACDRHCNIVNAWYCWLP